jgi:hypothetical protein
VKTVIECEAIAETNNWKQRAAITVTVEGNQEHHINDGLKALEKAYHEMRETLRRYGRGRPS